MPTGFPEIIQNPGMKVVEKGRNAVLVCEVSAGLLLVQTGRNCWRNSVDGTLKY